MHLLADLFTRLFDRRADLLANETPVNNVAARGIVADMIDDEHDEDGEQDPCQYA